MVMYFQKKAYIFALLLIGSINLSVAIPYVPAFSQGIKIPSISGLKVSSAIKKSAAGIAITLASLVFAEKQVEKTEWYRNKAGWMYANDQAESSIDRFTATSKYGKWLENEIYRTINYQGLKKRGWLFDPSKKLKLSKVDYGRQYVVEEVSGNNKMFYIWVFEDFKKNMGDWELKIPTSMRTAIGDIGSEPQFSLDERTNSDFKGYLLGAPDSYQPIGPDGQFDAANFNRLARKIAHVQAAYKSNKEVLGFLSFLTRQKHPYCVFLTPHTKEDDSFFDFEMVPEEAKDLDKAEGYNLLCRMYSAIACAKKEGKLGREQYMSRPIFKLRVYLNLLGIIKN